MTALFDKNVFFSNEVANSIVTIDNSQFNSKISEVEFQVIQRMRLPGWSSGFDLIESKDRSGINGNAPPVTKEMQLNLGAIRYSCSEYKKKMFGGKLKPRPAEEIFMLTHMAPATHSRYISNDYFLNVNVKYAASDCCA